MVNHIHRMDFITTVTKCNIYTSSPYLRMSMSRDADKHIRVTEDTWIELNQQKRPGDSFDDVIQRLLEKETESRPESNI